jgi:hypothetical protein
MAIPIAMYGSPGCGLYTDPDRDWTGLLRRISKDIDDVELPS